MLESSGEVLDGGVHRVLGAPRTVDLGWSRTTARLAVVWKANGRTACTAAAMAASASELANPSATRAC
ncbi:MAG: hypothetical protein CM1200mP26_30360 [Acidimicrobiales bacterium]|nr:MAG: hypothetical protein CM1200mP26_30360 [Acidimicrobiales bacterium]